MESSAKDMPVDDFIKAIDEITGIVDPNKTTIVFTGGEPLLRSDLEICGKKLYDRGFPWGTVTNGMLLNNSRLNSLMKAGLRTITISLDGLEPQHNWLRGNQKSFSQALAAIKLLTKIPDLRFDVVTCVNKKNFRELSEIRDLLISTGLKEWRLFTIFPIGRALKEPDLQLDPVQFKSLFSFITEERKRSKIKVNYGCEGFLGNYEGKVRDNFFFCRAGINVASVLADGSISACPNLRENFIQGNIYQDNFRDVWMNRYSIMRDRTWMKKDECAECNFFRYCGGNGLHLRDEKNGSLLFCHLNRIKEGEGQMTNPPHST